MNQKADSKVEWWKTCAGCGSRFKDSMSKFFGRFPIPVRVFKQQSGECCDCKEKRDIHYKTLFFARDLHWDYESVKEYFTENPPYKGQELLILDTSYNVNTYALVTVEKPEHTRQKRIVISCYTNGYSGQSFYRSGKNCFSPKGQVRLFPYNKKIGDMIKKSGSSELIISSEDVLKIIGRKLPNL